MRQERVIVGAYLFRLTEEDMKNRRALEKSFGGDFADILRKLLAEAVGKADSPRDRKGGKPSVQAVIDAFKINFPMDGSEAESRRYAWLLIQKVMRERKGTSEDEAARQIVVLIQAARQHEWWDSRITSMKTLYYKAHQIANAIREQRTPKIISI